MFDIAILRQFVHNCKILAEVRILHTGWCYFVTKHKITGIKILSISIARLSISVYCWFKPRVRLDLR